VTGRAKNLRVLALGLVAIVLGHLPTLNAPFVNQEWVFAEGTRALLDSGYHQGLERFWHHQANPLGYPLLTAGFLGSTGLPVEFWTVRLPSLLGGCLLLVAGYRLAASGGRFALWAALVCACPLVWCYIGQATADVLPAALALWAGVEAYRAGSQTGGHLRAASLLALGGVIKFNCLLLAPGLAFAAWTLPAGERSSVRKRALLAAAHFAIPAVGLGAYVVWLWSAHGVWVLPEKFKAVHGPGDSVRAWPATFIMYATYLTMLLGGLALWPVLFYAERLRRRTVLICGAALLLTTGLVFRIVLEFGLGEMDQGGFDLLLPGWALASARVTALALAVVLVLGLLARAIRDRSRLALFVAWTVLPYLAVASTARPAQRYLLLVFPLVVWFVLNELAPRWRWATVLAWTTVAGFAALSFTGTVYLEAQARAADRMALWISTHADPEETDPGPIASHAGQYFPTEPTTRRRYAVTLTEGRTEVLHREEVRVFGRLIRTYVLVRVGVPVPAAAA
jgi:hypothetical protein